MSVIVVDPDSGEVVPDDATQPFPNPGEVSLDHVAQAASRVEAQYQKDTTLLATIAGHAGLAQRIENCLNSIPGLLAVASDNPSATTNVNLDAVGNLVGQSRVLSDGTIRTNAELVTAIGLRILRNTSIASSPQCVAALTAIFGSTPFRYYDLGGMSVGIEIATGAAPSSDTISLLDDGVSPIARAMGVGVGRVWYTPSSYFGFAEDTRSGRKGFGLESNLSLGGEFGMLF